MTRLTLAAVAALFAFALAARADTPQQVFEKRILPIFKSPNPSSCVQCHLAGVDLRDYIRPGAEETFRSLRDQGLIDLDAPERSKILTLISMGTEDKKAPAVHAANRKAEYEAFAAWIKACAADGSLRLSPKLSTIVVARPAAPDAVIRHGRTDRLLASFEKTVWAMRFRCMNCHTEGTPQNDKNVKEFGPRVAWVKKGGPKDTMDYLLASKLVDPKEPDKSLLLQKPLGAVKHEGGVKFAPGDQGYKAFRQWIEDVAALRTGKYAKAADLPPTDTGPLRFGTEAWLKLADTPPEWGDRLLQVDVYAWDAKAGTWEQKPVATSDRIVWGKGKLWQHTVTLMAESGSERAKAWSAGKPALPPGRYLLKVYVDRDGRLKQDWTATLGEADYVGQVEARGAWREGYNAMTVADAGKVRK
ncbi:MAG TPA: hypothetical protein VKD90_09610 [Gemmataceae bacterium]|nr:hypothetical protein [Gemmataceae bacterium]